MSVRRIAIEKEIKAIADREHGLMMDLTMLHDSITSPQDRRWVEVRRTQSEITDCKIRRLELEKVLAEEIDEYIPDEGAPLQ